MSPVAIDFLERVGRNGRLLLDLINDVLDLSKIEAGRLTLHLQPVAVGAMVKQVLHGAQPLADSKGLALSLEDHTEAAMALADPRALSQIVTNLVGNSVKFTDKGWIRIDIHAERGRLLIDIADTGPGIAMEDQDAIFEAFRQVGEESRSGKGGSGLGLAISSRLASQMGGALTVRSQVGLGSTFRLELPAARATPSVAEARSQGPLVLAIDDDFDALALWQAQVERLGFTFVGLQAPGSAAQAAMDLQPAVVLLDILFPDGSGWDVLQKLRDEPATASIPVLIISVTDDDRLGDRTGITFLQKPLSEARLAAVLQPFRSAKIVAAR